MGKPMSITRSNDGNRRPGDRRLILLDGDRDWTLQSAQALIARLNPQRPVWISNADIDGAVAPLRVQRLLGGECSLLVIDAWSGLDADAIGAAVGTLRGGGLLLLLTPALARWTGQPDPEAARIAVHPFGAADVGARFIARLVRLLSASPAVLRARALADGDPAAGLGNRPPRLGTPPDLAPTSSGTASRVRTRAYSSAALQEPTASRAGSASPERSTSAERSASQEPSASGQAGGAGEADGGVGTMAPVASTADLIIDSLLRAGVIQEASEPDLDPAYPAGREQAEAVEAIIRLARGRARRPLALIADRGRGKSAALGIAAARLIQAPGVHILVTAPRRSAADSLFAHAEASLRAAGHSGASESLRFVAPDALLDKRPRADVLLVDEAAGIPAPLLAAMLDHYGRICFASTVNGYEGTGRGFEVRFRTVLDARAPGWRVLRLSTPIRWRAGDPLETLVDEMLLLDAEPAADTQVAATDLGELQFSRESSDALARDDERLRQLFGLLVLGHYQTRPNDLRHLLDGPNLSVMTLSSGELVAATALVAREGALEPELHRPIFAGRRRPRGHLLPQTLSAHAGLFEAPALRFARVVRITVHPAARRQGVGKTLVAKIAEHAAADGIDLLGASFGATTDLLAFWRHCGLRPLHLGTHRNSASGQRAAVVLRSLSQRGHRLCEQAGRRLLRDLPVLLSGPLQAVEPGIIAALLREVAVTESPACDEPHDAADRSVIDAFADAHRGLETSLPALARLAWWALTGDRAARYDVSPVHRDLLVRVVLQQRSLGDASEQLRLSGRSELLGQLRAAVAAVRDAVGAHANSDSTAGEDEPPCNQPH